MNPYSYFFPRLEQVLCSYFMCYPGGFSCTIFIKREKKENQRHTHGRNESVDLYAYIPSIFLTDPEQVRSSIRTTSLLSHPL